MTDWSGVWTQYLRYCIFYTDVKHGLFVNSDQEELDEIVEGCALERLNKDAVDCLEQTRKDWERFWSGYE